MFVHAREIGAAKNFSITIIYDCTDKPTWELVNALKTYIKMMDNIENLEAAVLIRGVSKSYGNEKILDNLNVTVTKGTM